MVRLLELRALCVRYGRGPRVVDRVSLTVDAGELHALLGPNGAGKSSLLRAALGLVPVEAGEVLLSGQRLAELGPVQRARRAAMLLQGLVPPPGLSVLALVLMGRHPHLGGLARPGPADRARAEAAMAALGVEALAHRRLGSLSGGERQRVLLARALCQDTPLLLLDEPTSSLDPGHKLEILAGLRAHVRAGGRGLLWVTHDLNLAAQFADRASLLDRGRIVATGGPDEVLEPTVLRGVYGPAFVHGRRHAAAAGAERPFALAWLEDAAPVSEPGRSRPGDPESGC